jgi:hypothetical protein
MKSFLIAAGCALALSACATGPGYGYGGGSLAYNAYYDDAYGPYYDGYWGRDGGFWYSSGRGAPYLRDGGEHFRRSAVEVAGANIGQRTDVEATVGAPEAHAFHGVHGRAGLHRH